MENNNYEHNKNFNLRVFFPYIKMENNNYEHDKNFNLRNFFPCIKMENNNYEHMRVSTLKNLAREKGLRGYSRLRKSELIRRLREPTAPREPIRKELIALATERGLGGYSRLRKSELIRRLREPTAPSDQTLDQGIDARMANVPFSTPTTYVLPKATPTPSPTSNAVQDLIDYLNDIEERPKSFSSPKQHKLKDEVDRIFEELEKF